MAVDGFELLPLFCIRLAGRPFDHLERLGLGETLSIARRVNALESQVGAAADEALKAIRANPAALPNDARVKFGKPLGIRQALPPEPCPVPEVERYRAVFDERAALLVKLDETLAREFASSRRLLLESVKEAVKPFAVFSTDEMNERIDQALQKGVDGGYDRRARERERHLLLYLQRVCAKNDTVSEFGPTGWGRVDAEEQGVRLNTKPGIARRELYLERWVVDGVVAAMNQDPEVRPELCPRVHPAGRLDGDEFIREDKGERRALSAEEKAVVLACDGKTPAWKLGPLEALAKDGVLLWELEVVAFDPHRLERLHEDILAFRPGPARERWSAKVERLLSLAKTFGEAKDFDTRSATMAKAREELAALGREGKEGRELYSSHNPIGEDCAREVELRLGRRVAEEFTRDAAPWLDLWCDAFAFAARPWGEALAAQHRTAPRTNGKVLLPAFLRHCATNGLPINGASYQRLCEPAFAQVRAAFAETLSTRTDADEWELSSDDCHVLRKRFGVQRFGELSYPSVDLMISAPSEEAVAAGQYQCVLSELHLSNLLFQHALFWSCPDKAALGEVYRRALDRTPFFSILGVDNSNHVALRPYDAVPDLWTFVSPLRGRPDYPTVKMSDAEVVLDERGPDVRLRAVSDGRDLGSFVRHWGVPSSSMHPFLFLSRKHMPRLRLGRVIVQRQFWTVGLQDLSGGPFQGLTGKLVASIERLRAELRLPRFVFGRPPMDVVARAGARDKDVKPVFYDFESYHSLESFQHMLSKHGALELSEMLPAPEDMLWREPTGKYVYELRGLIGPRSSPAGGGASR